MPLVTRLLTVLFVVCAAAPAIAEQGRPDRDVGLEALQLRDGVTLNTARKGSVPDGVASGAYANRERDGRAVCVRQTIAVVDADAGPDAPAATEIVVVCSR